MIDLAKIAAAERARAAIPFGAHPEDCADRTCRACLERAQARYEYTQVGQLEDDGPLLLVRTYCCGSCGSHYSSNCTLAPANAVVDTVVDRRAWLGRDQSGVHAIAPLSVPAGAGAYSLSGDLIDDSPAIVRGAS